MITSLQSLQAAASKRNSCQGHGGAAKGIDDNDGTSNSSTVDNCSRDPESKPTVQARRSSAASKQEVWLHHVQNMVRRLLQSKALLETLDQEMQVMQGHLNPNP
jgi:hypothetical protein